MSHLASAVDLRAYQRKRWCRLKAELSVINGHSHRQCRASPGNFSPGRRRRGSGAGGHVSSEDLVRVAVQSIRVPRVSSRTGPRVRFPKIRKPSRPSRATSAKSYRFGDSRAADMLGG